MPAETPVVCSQTVQEEQPAVLKYDKLLTHFSSWTAEACTWSEQLPLPPPFTFWFPGFSEKWGKRGRASQASKRRESARIQFSRNSQDLSLQLQFPRKRKHAWNRKVSRRAGSCFLPRTAFGLQIRFKQGLEDSFCNLIFPLVEDAEYYAFFFFFLAREMQ